MVIMSIACGTFGSQKTVLADLVIGWSGKFSDIFIGHRLFGHLSVSQILVAVVSGSHRVHETGLLWLAP